jgi:hypothetical protein
MTNIPETLEQEFYTEENVILVAIPCDNLNVVTHELGLDESDIRNTYGPFTMAIAREVAGDMIINGFMTGLNNEFNSTFPTNLPVHEILFTIVSDNVEDDIVIADTWAARDFPWSDCACSEKHEAYEM